MKVAAMSERGDAEEESRCSTEMWQRRLRGYMHGDDLGRSARQQGGECDFTTPDHRTINPRTPPTTHANADHWCNRASESERW